MQAGPRRTLFVREARPDKSVIDSMRGFPSKLSPTQTEAKPPDWSAISARSTISAAVVTPNNTPRLGRVKPTFMSTPSHSGRVRSAPDIAVFDGDHDAAQPRSTVCGHHRTTGQARLQ